MPFVPEFRVADRLAPFPLPFAPSPTDVREWKVEIDPTGTKLSTPLPDNGTLRVGLHRILIETGIALTPATSSWDPRSWFALYRYGSDFAGTEPSLRFYGGVTDKDPRHSAVAAEEVATGVTCYLLREHFGLDHIADVFPCIQRGELEYVDPDSEVRPDYFCEDASGLTVIAESKGTVGTRSDITRQIEPKGWSQVQNVRPTRQPLRQTCSRVVLGTHVCIAGIHPKSETTTLIKDPDGERPEVADDDADELLRVAYAKAFRFMQQDAFAERLLFHQELPNIDEEERLPSSNGIPFLPLSKSPFGDLVGLYGPTLKSLFANSNRSLRASVMRSLVGFRRQRLELSGRGYALPNGVIVLHDVDAVDWRM
ncbi:MAG TPA: hypothetical protein VJZ71_16575 [Phycisphaerae bacterium]|nr:hypothetical protein [Phycisphaerae bacterium]